MRTKIFGCCFCSSYKRTEQFIYLGFIPENSALLNLSQYDLPLAPQYHSDVLK